MIYMDGTMPILHMLADLLIIKIRHHYARFIRNYMKLHANNLVHQNRDNFFKIWFWPSWLNVYIESPYWQSIYMGGKKPKNKESLWIEWQCGWFLMPGKELYVWGSLSNVTVWEWKRNSCQDNSTKYKYNTVCICQSSLKVSNVSHSFVLIAMIIYLVNSTNNW